MTSSVVFGISSFGNYPRDSNIFNSLTSRSRLRSLRSLLSSRYQVGRSRPVDLSPQQHAIHCTAFRRHPFEMSSIGNSSPSATNTLRSASEPPSWNSDNACLASYMIDLKRYIWVHSDGRYKSLLLHGYKTDRRQVIVACAAHGILIHHNALPPFGVNSPSPTDTDAYELLLTEAIAEGRLPRALFTPVAPPVAAAAPAAPPPPSTPPGAGFTSTSSRTKSREHESTTPPTSDSSCPPRPFTSRTKL